MALCILLSFSTPAELGAILANAQGLIGVLTAPEAVVEQLEHQAAPEAPAAPAEAVVEQLEHQVAPEAPAAPAKAVVEQLEHQVAPEAPAAPAEAVVEQQLAQPAAPVLRPTRRAGGGARRAHRP